MRKISKDVMLNGAGCSIGIIQTILTDTYLGEIPWIGEIIPYPWDQWGTFGNILIGGITFGISQFTNVIKNYNLKTAIGIYGITTLVGGIMNGLFNPYRAGLTGRNGYFTPEYYPGYKGTFYRRPETKAKGFGSDITINPMAALPTKTPENIILA